MAQSATLPESNTALTYTKPSSTPHLTHTPVPTPGSDELLIRVHAAAINPVDIQLWGNPVVGFLAGSKEKGIGRDYSGEIVKVGEDLKRDGWKEGDEVFGLCNRPTAEGTITSYLVISPYNCPIAKKPSSLPHTHAASIPLVTLTAFACLAWLPPASKSPNSPSPRRVVVSGASGGVGTWCVQLAKKVYNTHVTAICSSRNADFVKELGADEVIDYATQDVAQSLLSKRPGGKKYDLYIDCVGGTEMFKYWTQLLHPHAAYITIVGDKTARDAMGGPLTYFTYPAQVLRFIRGWMVGPRYANVLLLQDSRCLEQVAELVEKGEVKVEVQEVVHGALKEEGHVEAWEKVKGEMIKGRVRGKLVLDCLE